MADIYVVVRKKRGSPFDRLAPELIIDIISQLPNLKSVLSFGLTSHKHLAILVENEGTIARNLARTILGDDDPEVVRLAFLAANAVPLSRDPRVHLVRKFIRRYVNPAKEPAYMYQFRALPAMRNLSISVELLIDWTATYGIPWPLKLESKAFTATEATQMRRIIYLAEAGIRLLCTVPKPELGRLADKFWSSFPLWDVDRAYAFLRLISSPDLDFTEWSRHVAGRGSGELFNFPWHAHDELRNKLHILKFSTWHNHAPFGQTTMFPRLAIRSNYFFCHYFNRCTDKPTLSWATKRTWYSGLDRDEIDWTKVSGYYDPGIFNHRRLYDWFFVIADEERRREVTDKGLIWSWDPEPQGDELLTQQSPTAAIVWHEDPSNFGWKGSIDEQVPIMDIVELRYI